MPAVETCACGRCHLRSTVDECSNRSGGPTGYGVHVKLRVPPVTLLEYDGLRSADCPGFIAANTESGAEPTTEPVESRTCISTEIPPGQPSRGMATMFQHHE